MDESTTLAELKRLIDQFVAERDWAKFHSPKNLSMAVGIEAAELMNLFTWLTESESIEAMEGGLREAAIEELADVVIYALAFANRSRVDIAEAVRQKVAKNRTKYPAEVFKGQV